MRKVLLTLCFLLFVRVGWAADASNVQQPVLDVANATVKTTSVTVTTSATQLPATNLTARKLLLIYNNDTVDVYIGGCSSSGSNNVVTTANGIIVASGGTLGLPVSNGASVCAIVTASTANVRVLEIQ